MSSLGVQRAACRQSRSLDVVQPAALDVGRAWPPRDAGGGPWGCRSACRRHHPCWTRAGAFDDVQSVHWRVVFARLRGCDRGRRDSPSAESRRCSGTRLPPRSPAWPLRGVWPTTWSKAHRAWCCMGSAATRETRRSPRSCCPLVHSSFPRLLECGLPGESRGVPGPRSPALRSDWLCSISCASRWKGLTSVSAQVSCCSWRCPALRPSGLRAYGPAAEPPRAAAVALCALLVAVGLPTTLIDSYNAQDVTNRRMGPGFHWTIALTPDEQEAHAWIRRETPRDAIVQMDPIAHGRETWSQLPTFAWRRMAAARPISLMNIPVYAERSRRAHRIYADRNPAAAAKLAAELGIDYIFIGPAERKGNPRPRWRNSTSGPTSSGRSSRTPAPDLRSRAVTAAVCAVTELDDPGGALRTAIDGLAFAIEQRSETGCQGCRRRIKPSLAARQAGGNQFRHACFRRGRTHDHAARTRRQRARKTARRRVVRARRA